MEKKPIIVTGMAKTGSTWVGRTLAYSDNVHYIHEAFSHAKFFNHDFRLFYNDVSLFNEEDKTKVIHYLKKYKRVEYKRLIDELRRIILRKESSYQTNRNIYSINDILTYLYKKKMPLYKEPAAIMSAGFFYNELAAKMIILIRHPAAVIGSMKAHRMNLHFSVFKEREMYNASYIEPFKNEIDALADRDNADIVEKGILLWKIIYNRIHQYKNKYRDWHFVKHEDISLNPAHEFGEMYKYLDVPFTEKIKKRILNDTQKEGDPLSVIKKGGFTFSLRNSKENIKYWQKRLTEKEIAKIRESTYSVWKLFYKDSDWE